MTRTLAALGLAAALVLTGCAAQPDADGLTLLQTKSPVQLMRNEAADRLDPAVFDTVRKSTDASFPCVTDDGNDGGLVRQWKSSADLGLVAGADQDAAAEALVATFVAQGWSAQKLEEAGVDLTELSKSDSIAVIRVAAADESTSSLVRITALGPCVVTGGPDSDEVVDLG